jgi:hypothetical protein
MTPVNVSLTQMPAVSSPRSRVNPSRSSIPLRPIRSSSADNVAITIGCEM